MTVGALALFVWRELVAPVPAAAAVFRAAGRLAAALRAAGFAAFGALAGFGAAGSATPVARERAPPAGAFAFARRPAGAPPLRSTFSARIASASSSVSVSALSRSGSVALTAPCSVLLVR